MVKTQGQKEVAISVKLSPVSAPSAEQGLMYFDASLSKLKVCNDGTNFRNVGEFTDNGLLKTSIVNAINNQKLATTSGYQITAPDNFIYDLFDTDTASTATGLVHSGASDAYWINGTASSVTLVTGSTAISSGPYEVALKSDYTLNAGNTIAIYASVDDGTSWTLMPNQGDAIAISTAASAMKFKFEVTRTATAASNEIITEFGALYG